MANKPFFIPQKEVDLFDKMNTELIDQLVGQTVDVYKVSLDESDSNLYGESKGGEKVFEKGYQVNCLISWSEPESDMKEFGTDVDTSVELYFLRSSLAETEFYPEIGDVVDWNDYYFEINSVTEPQIIHGHQGFKHEVKCNAHRIRLSSINFSERFR